MKPRILSSLMGLALAAAGCTMAPKYSRPAAPVPAAWPTGPAYAATPPSNDAQLPAWEDYFTNPQLQEVIHLALAADRENLRLSETTLQGQQAGYDLIQRRHELGLVAELDLLRAQTPLEVARRDVAFYLQQVAQGENALTLLIGAPVPAELLPADLGRISPPHNLSPGLSSEVLLERPDVLEAENLLKAANADIGAARGTVNRQVNAQQSLVNALSETYRLSNSRFEKGIDSYLGVLDAQRSLFAAQQVLVVLRLEALASRVRLYAALGGGWQEEGSAGKTARNSSGPHQLKQ